MLEVGVEDIDKPCDMRLDFRRDNSAASSSVTSKLNRRSVTVEALSDDDRREGAVGGLVGVV